METISGKTINCSGIQVLRTLLDTTNDDITKQRIQARITYLQNKYKNKKSKKPSIRSATSTSSLDSEDKTLVNEIKIIPFEEPLPKPVSITQANLCTSDYKTRVEQVVENIRNRLDINLPTKNGLRELINTINNHNYEIIELNIKLNKKI